MADSKVAEIYNNFAKDLDTHALTADEMDDLNRFILVRLNNHKELNRRVKEAANPSEEQQKISEVVSLVKGCGWTLTGHGIMQTLSGKFSCDQKEQIARLLANFVHHLKTMLNLESFLTSGTLLGCVRDDDFIVHDDDIDLAYISNHQEKPDIISERVEIMRAINEHPKFSAKETEGARFVVTVEEGDLRFWFDFFTSFCSGGFFNEFPLKPNTLRVEDIIPLKFVSFLGSELPVPREPEKLLEINYGKSWRIPDPAFRFNFGEHQDFYWFLCSNRLKQNGEEG